MDMYSIINYTKILNKEFEHKNVFKYNTRIKLFKYFISLFKKYC